MALASVLLAASVVHARPVNIGLVVDGSWPWLDSFRALVETQVGELTAGEFDVRFPAEKTIETDWSATGVTGAVERLLADDDVDMIIGVGVLASHVLGTHESTRREGGFPKPVIAPFVLDRALQRFPSRDGHSGVDGLVYLDSPTNLTTEIQVFRDIVPFEHLSMLISGALADLMVGFELPLQRGAASVGVTIDVVRIESTVEQTLAALPADTDAVLVGPMLEFDDTARDAFVRGLIDRKLPSFSYLGQHDVERGILAGILPASDFSRRARRVALIVQRILLGEAPEAISVEFDSRARLMLNVATARRIGFSATWEVLVDAELIDDFEPPAVRRISLPQAVDEAVSRNLALSEKAHRVAAGAQDVFASRSRLLPQVDLVATGVLIDKDRAAASLGSRSEWTGSVGFQISQLLFDQGALADVAIRRELQRGLEAEEEALRLDVILLTATAYLDVLRAETLERIEDANLALTRANLERARNRQAIGLASPAEVYRWESELAQDKRDLINALTKKFEAENELNRLLDRPLTETFEPLDVGLEVAQLGPGPEGLLTYVDNPSGYGVFVDFLVHEGLARSPELAQLSHAIAAQQRLVSAGERAFWLPTIGVQGEFEQRALQDGEGGAGFGEASEPAPGEPPSPLAGLVLPKANRTDWSLGLRISLPFSTGGRRHAERDKAREDLTALKVLRRSTGQNVEQRIRFWMHEAQASYLGIDLARDSAEAAEKNLELVTDAYARGVVSIVELLDAQNAARNARQAADSALYDFLGDVLQVYRGANMFPFYVTAESERDFFARLDAFFREVETTGVIR